MIAKFEVNLEETEQLTMAEVSKIKRIAKDKGLEFGDVLAGLAKIGLEQSNNEEEN